MKLKIKIKELENGCMPIIRENGDWIDLISSSEVIVHAAQSGILRKVNNTNYRDVTSEVDYVPLGVAIKLPAGFEAIIAPRSSTPGKIGVFCANSFGIVDETYQGNDDEWKFVVSPIRHCIIHKGDRICQFRIQLSQKATVWQKLKWLFSSGIELVQVDNLESNNRGGFGSTGIK